MSNTLICKIKINAIKNIIEQSTHYIVHASKGAFINLRDPKIITWLHAVNNYISICSKLEHNNVARFLIKLLINS